MAARDTQVAGDHYMIMEIQPWDVMDDWPLEQQVGAYRHGLLKYTMRMGSKDDRIQEIRKAAHCAQRLVEILEYAQREEEIKESLEDVVEGTSAALHEAIKPSESLDENAGDAFDRAAFEKEWKRQLDAQRADEVQRRVQMTWAARTQPEEDKDGPQPRCFTDYPHRNTQELVERSCGDCMWEGQCADRTPRPDPIMSMPGHIIIDPAHLG